MLDYFCKGGILLKKKKGIAWLMGFVLLVNVAVNQFLFAGVISPLYFLVVSLVLLGVFFIIHRRVNAIWLLGLLMVQLVLSGMLYPKYTYYDAKEMILTNTHVTQVVDGSPKSISTASPAFAIVKDGYWFKILYDNETKEVVINPKTLIAYDDYFQ